MKNLFIILFLFALSGSSFAGEKFFNYENLLRGGSVNYDENRTFKIKSIGHKKYFGPLYCSDKLLSGLNGGYKKSECLTLNKGEKYWLALEAEEFFSDQLVRNSKLKFTGSEFDEVRKFSARITFYDSVAVVSFEGVVSNSYRFKFSLNENVDHKSVNFWEPFPHLCSSDRLLVFDILKNQSTLFQLSDLELRNLELIDAIGNPEFPYFLKYTDDDVIWGMNGSAANSGSNIYIFIGDNKFKIISEVAFGLCTPDGSFVKEIEDNHDLGAKLRYNHMRK